MYNRNVKIGGTDLKLLKRNLFTCRHLEINSDRLFNKGNFDVIIRNFYVRHKLHVYCRFCRKMYD